MKGEGRRATIKDVANLAGVSPTTVSMVLNGKDVSLPERTRERVRRAAEALHYSTDALARALVTRKTNIIGVVIPDISNAFFSEAVRRIQTEFAAFGYDIILCNSGERAEQDVRYLRLLAGRHVDGLLLTPSAEALSGENAARFRAALGETDIPYLFFDRYYAGSPHVSVDNEAGGRQAARYLLARGHRKIGVVAGPLSLNSSRNRLQGVRSALTECGLSLSEECIFEGKYDFTTGVRGGEALVRQGVTAIFACSDMQAYGVCESAARMGLRVPDDLSVMGFDDNPYSAMREVPLTTMRQPVERLAKEVCRVLLARIGGDGSAPPPERFPAELVERGSVGAPRAASSPARAAGAENFR